MLKSTLLKITLLIIFTCPLIAHMIIGSHSRMMADDFCTSYLGQSEGLIGGFIVQYNTWAGQPSNILIKNAVGILGSWLIPLLPILVIIIWLFISMWTLNQIFSKKQLPFELTLLLSTILIFAILDGSPMVVQSLYWLAAVVPYTMPLLVATFFIGFLARTLQQDQSLGISHLTFSLIIGFVAGGFSETYVATQFGLLLAGIITCSVLPHKRLKKRATPLLAAAFIGTVLVMIVILLAPGNSIRREHFENSLSLVDFVITSILQSVAFVIASLTSFSLVGVLTTFISFLLIAIYFIPPYRITITPTKIMLLLLLIFLPIGGYIATGIYAQGNIPPARTFIITQALLTGLLAFVGYAVGIKLQKQVKGLRPSTLYPLLTVGVSICILGTLQATLKTMNLLPYYQTFSAEFDAREQYIYSAVERGETNLVVAPFTIDISERIGLQPLGDDVTFWVNTCTADYYGLETILVES